MELCKSKKCQLEKLSEIKKFKLKNSRPTPDIVITQDCSLSGMKFIFLILLKLWIFLTC